MLKEERQTWILNKLHSSGKVVVSHLAGELKVSEDTIRRDLLDLDQKGQLKRVFGGAIPLEKPVINFFDRETADVALKQQLAMRALEFLEPDQLVAIDGSSTNLQFAKNIPDNLKLTVLTNSYSIAHVCSLKEQIRVIILGGDLLKDSMTTVGEIAAAQAAGLFKSASEARRAIKSGGVYLNNNRIEDEEQVLAEADFLAGRFALIRRGKKALGAVENR